MRSRRPKIGITLSEANASPIFRWPVRKSFDYLKQEYFQAIFKAGGLPVLFPNTDNPKLTEELMNSVDGILLTGGGDLNPRYFGQKPHESLSPLNAARDAFEMRLVRLAIKKKMPLLAICRGHQVLNVVLGGTLYQDLSCLPFQTLSHSDPQQTAKVFHKVNVINGSRLSRIIGSRSITTNSSHHQAVDKLGKNLRAAAFAPDGVLEAIEHTKNDFVIGVQWHPEGIAKREHSQKLFKAFVKASAKK